MFNTIEELGEKLVKFLLQEKGLTTFEAIEALKLAQDVIDCKIHQEGHKKPLSDYFNIEI